MSVSPLITALAGAVWARLRAAWDVGNDGRNNSYNGGMVYFGRAWPTASRSLYVLEGWHHTIALSVPYGPGPVLGIAEDNDVTWGLTSWDAEEGP